MGARVLIATAIAAASAAAAVYLHDYKQPPRSTPTSIVGSESSSRITRRGSANRHPSWADPAAVLVLVLGAGAAAAILVGGRRRLT